MSVSKSTQLKRIDRDTERLTDSPLYQYRVQEGYHAVPGKGNPDAVLMLIGEAPGKQEAMRGEPFVGAAGRLLDELLQSIHVTRDEVYITNIVKDRPPENRAPQKNEVNAYAPLLRRQIKIIQPQVIVTLGRYAMEFILAEFKMPEQGRSISELHGKPLRAQTPYGPIAVLPLFHPAVAFYRRDQKEILKSDFLVLKGLL
ncbi:MAG TPA: uracil-DNA glycosylase [Anaerolineales bacterium]|nr:uracil-DNA glycosylase [Anaerolineales bacterium]